MANRRATALPDLRDGSTGQRSAIFEGGYRLNPQIRALALLLCVSLAITLALLFWSAKAQDEIAIASSRHLADTALAIQERSLRSTLTDYTYWDAAYSNVVKDFSLDWYHDELGAFPYLTDTFGITAAAIVGPGNRVLVLTKEGNSETDSEAIQLNDVAKGLVDSVASARRVIADDFLAVSGFVTMDGQLYLAAARVIHPHSEDYLAKEGITPENATVAVFLKPLDADALKTIARNFSLMDLGYQPSVAAAEQLSISLSTLGGEPLGHLTWRADRPSHRIFTVMLPALIVVISLIGLLAGYLLSVVRHGQQSLFTAMLEAQAANRAKSEFLANMSHELRTPMNGVIGIAELLKRGSLTDDQRMLMDHLLTAANDQMAIINDLLDITRIESGRIELNEDVFDPASVVRSAVSLIKSKAEEKGLGLQIEVPDGESIEVVGDSGRYKQIVLNLLSNAIKFTENGKIRVALVTERSGNLTEIGLTVADTGVGISDADQARIFDRFMQADTSTARRAEGAGLGLAICKALVDAMNGTIEIASKLGEGTSVKVALKLPDASNDSVAMRGVA